MILATNTTDYSSGDLGIVEVAASALNDRKHKQYSKGELIKWANFEQLHLANIINLLYEPYFVTSTTTDTVAGDGVYQLPTDMVQLLGIEIADSVTDAEPYQLVQIPWTDRQWYQQLEDVNSKREFGFYFLAGTTYRLEPGPAAAGKKIRVWMVERVADLVNDSDVSKIPVEHHELLALGAARRGRVKFNKRNSALDEQYAELLAVMRQSMSKMARHFDERVEPWRGSSGPVPPWVVGAR